MTPLPDAPVPSSALSGPIGEDVLNDIGYDPAFDSLVFTVRVDEGVALNCAS